MQRYNRKLYRTARGILGDDSEAEDVVQEAYVRAFRHLASFRGDSAFELGSLASPSMKLSAERENGLQRWNFAIWMLSRAKRSRA